MPNRGVLQAGEKVQFTDRKGKRITDQLTVGGTTQTEHGLIMHDQIIGRTEGIVVTTVRAKREAQINQQHPERDEGKPWKSARAIATEAVERDPACETPGFADAITATTLLSAGDWAASG